MTVTAEQFYATAREVVAERPDFVYTPPVPLVDGSADPDAGMCRYVHTDGQGNDSCGCVIGHVLHKLGVPLAEMAKREGAPASSQLRRFFGFEINSSVANFADELQYRQDAGITWGKALEHAEGYAPTKVIV